MVELFKVVRQDEVQQVPSQKAEGGMTQRCGIVLKKLGGKYADEYFATLWGNDAGLRFAPGDLVGAVLRFAVHEHNGVMFQDISVAGVVKFNN